MLMTRSSSTAITRTRRPLQFEQFLASLRLCAGVTTGDSESTRRRLRVSPLAEPSYATTSFSGQPTLTRSAYGLALLLVGGQACNRRPGPLPPRPSAVNQTLNQSLRDCQDVSRACVAAFTARSESFETLPPSTSPLRTGSAFSSPSSR